MRKRALPLPARFVLLVLLVVVAPLALMGTWLAGTAARSGEELLRTRLRQTNARVTAEMSGNWLRPRSALLGFGDAEAVQRELEAAPSASAALIQGRAPDDAPAELRERFEALPAAVVELTLRDAAGEAVWRLTRGPTPLPTFAVALPVHARFGGQRLGTLEARLLGDAVLGPGGALTAGVGAVVAVIDPADGASLRALPFDPSALGGARFQWDGETWVAERRVLLDPRLDVISAAPLAEFAAPFEAAAGRGLVMLLAVALLATVMAAVLTRRMTRSLGQLALAADAVSRGDLAARVPAGGGDEVGRVAQAFNRMAESLRRTLAELSQREALAAVGGFASELAHEVRNPLTSIKVDLQFVEEQLPEGSELRTVQRSALEEIVRLDRTVAGVLQIARSGRIALEPVDLREPLLAAVHAVEPRARAAGAALEVELPDAPLEVPGDRSALEQLFTNLLLNAAQAVGKGGRIRVQGESGHARSGGDPAPGDGMGVQQEAPVAAHASGKGTLRAAANAAPLRDTAGTGAILVRIRDDGAGIPPEQLARVREPFYSTRAEGTGLGLAIAGRIAAAHRAELRIESEPGKGTVVEVRFGAVAAGRNEP